MPCTINCNKGFTDCPDCGKLQTHCFTHGTKTVCNCQDNREDDRTGPPHFAGETNVEIIAGSSYRSAYSFRVF